MLKKFQNNKVFVFCLLVPFFKPEILKYIAPVMDSLFNIFRILSAGIAIMLYFYSVKTRESICFFGLLFSWQFLMLISAIVNKKDIRDCIVTMVTIISVCILTETCIKVNAYIFFSSLFALLFIEILINFIGIVIRPNGWAVRDYYYYPVHFLTIDNLLSPYMILAVVISIIYMQYTQKILLPFILIALIWITMLTLWSATGIVGLVCCFALIMLLKSNIMRELLNSFLLYFFLGIFNLFVFLVGLHNQIFESILAYLGKDATLSGRTIMWKQAFSLIKSRILLGYGPSEAHGYVFWHGKYFYTHNMILEIMIRGGIFSIIIYMLMILYVGFVLYKYRTKRVTTVIMAGIIANFVTLVTEAYIYAVPVFVVYMLAININQILQQTEQQSEIRTAFKLKVPRVKIITRKR